MPPRQVAQHREDSDEQERDDQEDASSHGVLADVRDAGRPSEVHSTEQRDDQEQRVVVRRCDHSAVRELVDSTQSATEGTRQPGRLPERAERNVSVHRIEQHVGAHGGDCGG